MGLVLEQTSTRSVEKLVEPHFNPQLSARELRYAKQFVSTHGGLLPGDSFWTYIRARYDLDPARFDHYHPRIEAMVAHDALVRWEMAHPRPSSPLSPPSPPSPLSPPSILVPSTPDPSLDPPDPTAVPEPSTAVLLATALVAFVVYRWIRVLTGSARVATARVFRTLVRG